MRAFVWDRDGQLKFDPYFPEPRCREDWVVIKVASAGVCATDLAVLKGEFGPPPLIPGHEIAGTVTEVGRLVRRVKPGARVVVETAVSCGHCRACLSGNKHLCPECHEIGFPPYNGGYAEYVTVPENCVKFLPDNVSFDEAGILEAALCPFGLIYRYGLEPGSTVLIQGCGAAGISFLQTVKCFSAAKVIVAVRRESAARTALRFGADAVIDTRREDLTERVLAETEGRGADLSIEATGSAGCIRQAVSLAASGGRVMLYGLPGAGAALPDFPAREIILRQLTVQGGTNHQGAWEPLLELVSAGKFNLKDMVTDIYPLEEAPAALEKTKARPDGFIKAVLHP